MRVTNKMITKNAQEYINRNLSNLNDVSNQLYSGKLLQSPSQNPFNATRIMDYNTQLARKEQYEKNIKEVQGFMDVSDSALNQVTEAMKKVKELTLKASNGIYGDDELQMMSEEIDALIETMVDSLNTTFENKHIFGGYQTDKPPFTIDRSSGVPVVSYNGDQNHSKVEISNNVFVDRNIVGDEIIGTNNPINGHNLFDTLSEISNAFKTGNTGALSNLDDEIDHHTDTVLKVRGKVGALSSRMENSLAKTKEEILSVKSMLGNLDSVDFADKIIEYNSLDAIYKASLQVAASIIQPSLMDFLR
ncbi:MAG: flagellar hook-associated protein FlgL [Turicibacter sp.]